MFVLDTPEEPVEETERVANLGVAPIVRLTIYVRMVTASSKMRNSTL